MQWLQFVVVGSLMLSFQGCGASSTPNPDDPAAMNAQPAESSLQALPSEDARAAKTYQETPGTPANKAAAKPGAKKEGYSCWRDDSSSKDGRLELDVMKNAEGTDLWTATYKLTKATAEDSQALTLSNQLKCHIIASPGKDAALCVNGDNETSLSIAHRADNVEVRVKSPQLGKTPVLLVFNDKAVDSGCQKF